MTKEKENLINQTIIDLLCCKGRTHVFKYFKEQGYNTSKIETILNEYLTNNVEDLARYLISLVDTKDFKSHDECKEFTIKMCKLITNWDIQKCIHFINSERPK